MAPRCRADVDRRDRSQPGDARSRNAIGTQRPVEWRQADAMALAVRRRRVRCGRMPVRRHVLSRSARGVCRGAPRAEAGRYVFVQRLGPDRRQRIRRVRATRPRIGVPADPPRFLREPRTVISTRTASARSRARRLRESSRHRRPSTARSRAASPRFPALGFCHGSPLRSEIAARDPARLGDVVDAATETLARRFGQDAIDGKMQAHVVTVRK